MKELKFVASREVVVVMGLRRDPATHCDHFGFVVPFEDGARCQRCGDNLDAEDMERLARWARES